MWGKSMTIMESRVLPEIFNLILDFAKAEQYNITTLRQLARTCTHLNSTLHKYILDKSKAYSKIYTTLGCSFIMTPRRSFVNELVLDRILNVITTDDMIITCCAAALSGNVDLLKKMTSKRLMCVIGHIKQCVGYSGSFEMFRLFKQLIVKVHFWKGCLEGALISDNINCLEFCSLNDMNHIIRSQILYHTEGYYKKLAITSRKCYDWLVKYDYIDEEKLIY